MRSTARSNRAGLAGLVTGAMLVALPAHGFAAAQPGGGAAGGVTVIPAALTVSLAKGEGMAQAAFRVSNSYSSAVALHFSFEQAAKAPGNNALPSLSITPADVAVPAGGSVAESVTLTDSSKLAPGGQQVDLVMAQQSLPGAQVQVVPSVRLPLTVVKEDGALTRFSAVPQGTAGFSLNLPASVAVLVKNTGNMIVIPRGFVSVTDPRGRTVRKGVLNTASLAVAPGDQLRLQTPLALLDHPWPPGPYHISVSYGIGGGQAMARTAVRLFYMPVWQMLLAVLIVALVVCFRQIWVEWLALRMRRPSGQAGQAPTPTETGGTTA
ncbi:MAG TPA: hypothetical protein VLF71_05265 [Candidatus Saccharimonadales bacterium]|nr:hypothetical protein [Candidatus Saccharimonadales bacterium]